MSLLHSLLLLPLLPLTFAAPAPGPSKRDNQYTTGVVPQGVNCFTSNEPLHSISADTITNFVTAGMTAVGPEAAGQRLYDLTFDPSTQMSSTYPELRYAEGCDPAAGLYAYPLVYEGTCEPRLYRSTNPPPCTGPLTTDVVLFTVEITQPLGTPRPSVTGSKYCAVLTNSEARSPTDGGTPDNFAIEGGYRQCFNNVV